MEEVCPFCKNPLNEGATACGSCGAFESTKLHQGWPGVNAILTLVGLPLLLIGALLGMLLKSYIMVAILGVGVPFLVCNGLFRLLGYKKKSWFMRHR